MKKKNIMISSILLLILLSVTGCSGENTAVGGTDEYTEAANLLTEVKTAQFFTDEKVSAGDTEKILSAGVNAPSAMNTQPWHFTAVTDEEVTAKLADAMSSMKPPAMQGEPPAAPSEDTSEKQTPPSEPSALPENVSDTSSKKDNFAKIAGKAGIGDAPLTIIISCNKDSEFDAGLAVQNMSAEAQLLGYSTKIMTAPAMALNSDEYKTLLNIPDGQKITAVLLVGKSENEEDNPDTVSSATERNPFDETVTMIGK